MLNMQSLVVAKENVGKMTKRKKLIKRVGLTPKDHPQLARHHFHDQHTLVSIRLYVGPPAVPLYQICAPDLV